SQLPPAAASSALVPRSASTPSRAADGEAAHEPHRPPSPLRGGVGGGGKPQEVAVAIDRRALHCVGNNERFPPRLHPTPTPSPSRVGGPRGCSSAVGGPDGNAAENEDHGDDQANADRLAESVRRAQRTHHGRRQDAQ